MADEADIAAKAEAFNLDLAISHRQTELKPDGQCHYCGTLVDKERKFCDADCRDEWEQYQRFHR